LVNISSGSATKLKDFTYLQKKVRAADPDGVKMSSYTASNKAASCPTVNSTWAASSKLPPTPQQDACTCMVKASGCVPKSGLASSKYSAIFDYVCGKNETLCDGINGNATTGVYGTYSMCNSVDQLAYVLNAYYESQDKDSTACDFDGKAETQTASTGDNCTALAESSNTTSDSSSSSNSSSESMAALTGSISHPFTVFGVDMSLFSVVALVGAGLLFV
jgi:hypothetical protein